MYRVQGTIRETLEHINRRELVIPAIQREFIWKEDQICQLFDSLMRGYPFGTFLYWKVNPENSASFRWYDIILNWHEKYGPHNSEAAPLPNTALTAILDGQQRLTALNIGLRGSMAWRLPRTWWKFDENFPTRHLYLNLLAKSSNNVDAQYDFRFLRSDMRQRPSDNEYWFKVSDILGLSTSTLLDNWLQARQVADNSHIAETLDILRKRIHEDKAIVAYEEHSQETERVLQIFIRMNRGGTPLSYSDLLLSVIIEQFGAMRNDILQFVDMLNGIGGGFNFSKDFVLKAGLMLLDLNVAFRVANFNRANTSKLRHDWENVKRALLLTVRLVSECFGFERSNLRTNNALLPVAYYLYKVAPGDAFLTNQAFNHNREAIRSWLVHSLIKRTLWGNGSDSLLTALRRVIRDDPTSNFPIGTINEVMIRRGRPLSFNESEIDNLVNMAYGDHRVFLVLSLLFPFLDIAHQFHVDHVFPRAKFSSEEMTTAGIPAEQHELYRTMANSLANLQLLIGAKNTQKQAVLPHEWLAREYSDASARQDYIDRHLLGEVPQGLDGFESFHNARHAQLRTRIQHLLRTA